MAGNGSDRPPPVSGRLGLSAGGGGYGLEVGCVRVPYHTPQKVRTQREDTQQRIILQAEELETESFVTGAKRRLERPRSGRATAAAGLIEQAGCGS